MNAGVTEESIQHADHDELMLGFVASLFAELSGDVNEEVGELHLRRRLQALGLAECSRRKLFLQQPVEEAVAEEGLLGELGAVSEGLAWIFLRAVQAHVLHLRAKLLRILLLNVAVLQNSLTHRQGLR